MTNQALTFEELIGIAPEMFFGGELDHAKLFAAVTSLEGYVLQRGSEAFAMSQALKHLSSRKPTNKVMKQLMRLTVDLNRLSDAEPRVLFTLMTHGSYPDACLGVYDLLKNLEASRVDVYVRAQAMCYGAATVILAGAQPGRRYAAANTTFTIDIGYHQVGFCQPSLPRPGTLPHRLMELYHAGTSLSRQEIAEMSPMPFGVEDALKFGLIDHVIGAE